MSVQQNAVDRAILAYRANPTEANRRALLAAQQQHTTAFYQQRAVEYIARTRG